MIDAQNIIDGFRQIDGINLKVETENFKEILEKIMQDLQIDNTDFFDFINELRRADMDDVNTRRLLDGRLQPAVLVDIIFSNKFDGTQMQVDNSTFFEIEIAGGDAGQYSAATTSAAGS